MLAESGVVEVPEVGGGTESRGEMLEQNRIEGGSFSRCSRKVFKFGDNSVWDIIGLGACGEDQVFDSLLSEGC